MALSFLTFQVRVQFKDPAGILSCPLCTLGGNPVSVSKAFACCPMRNQQEVKFVLRIKGRKEGHKYEAFSGLNMAEIYWVLTPGQAHAKHLTCNPHREGPMR